MKAYILKINTDISNEYAKVCAASCDSVGLQWQYFHGYQNMTGAMAFKKTGIKIAPLEDYHFVQNPSPGHKAMSCTAGHWSIWKKIANGPDEVGIVLEHDAIMLHPVTIDIPDNTITVLGYKLQDPSRYDHKAAGAPRELVSINGHEGAHAYAMTKKTAKFLINELEEMGAHSAVDNDYFIKNQRRTKVPLTIASPTPAMGWLRESSIWGKSAAVNYQFIPAFQKYYK